MHFKKQIFIALLLLQQQHNAVLENLKAIKRETYIFFRYGGPKNNKRSAKNSFKYHHHIYWHVYAFLLQHRCLKMFERV